MARFPRLAAALLVTAGLVVAWSVHAQPPGGLPAPGPGVPGDAPEGPRKVPGIPPFSLLGAEPVQAELKLTDEQKQKVRDLIAEFDKQARADMTALRAGETGTLRVATYQSISARVLPTVMRSFMGSWPGISLELSEPSNDETLYHGIESGAIDLGFCSLPVAEGPFAALELLTDPHVLLVSSDSPLAARPSISLADLEGVALIGSNLCSSGLVVENALRERGIPIDYAFRSDDNTTLQGLVAARFGVALMPLLAIQPGDDRVTVVPLDPPVPRRRLAVVWHRDRHRSPAARAFVEIAQAVSTDVERELAEQ